MSGLAPTIERPAQRRPRNLVIHQFRYELRSYLRNRQGIFFTFALPVMFLVIFASVFGHGTVQVPGGTLHVAIYYVPGIIAMGIISASFGNLAASVVGAREAGIYKRRRATPVSAVVLIAGRALVAITVALAITVVLLAIGRFYGASVPAHALPTLALDVVVGSLAFCCLGYALASILRSRDTVQPAIMFITLPLYFISGVFVASADLPHWLVSVANVFPVRHLATALLSVYNPHAATAGIRWNDLAVLAIWGAAGLFVAARRFSWLPRSR
jgi:ABC-2 type transport system permease protein